MFSQPVCLLQKSFQKHCSAADKHRISRFCINAPLSDAVQKIGNKILNHGFYCLYNSFLIILRFSLDDTVDICLLQKHVIFTVNTGNDIVIHGNHTFFQRITIIHIRSATSHQKIIRSKSANINPYDFRNLTDFHHPRHHGCIILRKRHYILYTEVIHFIVEAQFLHLPVPFEIAFISLTKLCKMLRRKPNRKFHLNDILRLDLAFLLQLHCNGK